MKAADYDWVRNARLCWNLCPWCHQYFPWHHLWQDPQEEASLKQKQSRCCNAPQVVTWVRFCFYIFIIAFRQKADFTVCKATKISWVVNRVNPPTNVGVCLSRVIGMCVGVRVCVSVVYTLRFERKTGKKWQRVWSWLKIEAWRRARKNETKRRENSSRQKRRARWKKWEGIKVGLVAEPTVLMLAVWSTQRQLAAACLPAANVQ